MFSVTVTYRNSAKSSSNPYGMNNETEKFEGVKSLSFSNWGMTLKNENGHVVFDKAHQLIISFNVDEEDNKIKFRQYL